MSLLKREYYDRKGKQIDSEKWMILFEDSEYRIVKQTYFKSGCFISTIWLGLTHFGPGELNIFETMIFKNKDLNKEFEFRFDSEKEALEHHELLIKQLIDEGEILND